MIGSMGVIFGALEPSGTVGNIKRTGWILGGAALLLMLWFNYTSDEAIKPTLAGFFAISMGGSLVCWGMHGIEKGEILIKRRHVRRDEHPLIFWATVIVFRLLTGSVLALGGVWHLFAGGKH